MTYTRDLKELIKCSGYAGVAGQSFRYHVAGAASSAKMSDYKLDWWNWTGGPGSPLHYPSGQVFNMSADLGPGSRLGYITRTGAGVITLSDVVVGPGGSVTLNSSNGSGATVDARVTIVSPWNPGASASISGTAKYYWAGTDQTDPPSDSSLMQGHFQARVTGGAGIGDGDYEDVTFKLSFVNPNAGTGHFNPDLGPTLFAASMYHRGIDYTDFDVQWHDNGSYTSLVSSAYDYYWTEPYVGASYSLWLRYRPHGGSTWTNVGEVQFIDPRLF